MASKYPFGDLNNVGDKVSFDVPATINAVRVAACLYGKRHGVKLKIKHLGTGPQIEQPENHNIFLAERVG
jgi:hypothetical protein